MTMQLRPNTFRNNQFDRGMQLTPSSFDFNSYQFQSMLKQRIGQLNLEKETRLDMRSLWDPFFNKEGRREAVKYYEKLTGISLDEDSWIIQNVASKVKLGDNLFFGIPTKIVNTIRGNADGLFDMNVKQELGTNLMNWLYFVGDTLDFLSFFVKSAIIAGQEDITYGKALEMSFGTGDEGRYKMDFQRIAENSDFWGDGFFPVMLGELLTDPLLVFALFKAAASGISKFVASLAKSSDDILLSYGVRKFAPAAKEFITKTVTESVDDVGEAAIKSRIKTAHRLNEAIKYGDESTYMKILSDQKLAGNLTQKQAIELGEAFTVNATKYKANAAMRFLTAADNVENKLIQTIGKANPMLATTRQFYRFGKWVRYGSADSAKALDFFSKNSDFTISEFQKMDLKELKRNIYALEQYYKHTNLSIEEAIEVTDMIKKARMFLHKKETADAIKLATDDRKTLQDKLAEVQKNKDAFLKETNTHDVDIYQQTYTRTERLKARISELSREIKKKQEHYKMIYQESSEKYAKAMDGFRKAQAELDLATKEFESMEFTADDGKLSQLLFDAKLEQFNVSMRRMRRAEAALQEAKEFDAFVDQITLDDEYFKLLEELDSNRKLHTEYSNRLGNLGKSMEETPGEFSTKQITLYEMNQNIKTLEAQIDELSQKIDTTNDFYEELKRIETLSKSVDYDEASKTNWTKYSKKENYDALVKQIEETATELHEAIQKMNAITGNKEGFLAAQETVGKLRSKLKLEQNQKSIVDTVVKMINYSALGTKQAEGVAHFIAKEGNETLKMVMHKFAKEHVSAYETLLKNRQPFLENALKNVGDGELSVDKLEADSAMQMEIKGYLDRITRLRGLLGNDIITDPIGFREISNTYTELTNKLNKAVKERYEEYKEIAYEVSRKFERWFDGDYELNRTAITDRISKAEQQIEFFKKPDNANPEKLAEWEKELADAQKALEDFSEELPVIDPEEILIRLDKELKSKANITPQDAAQAASHRALQKVYATDLYKLIKNEMKGQKASDVHTVFANKLVERADAIVKQRASLLGSATIRTVEKFTEDFASMWAPLARSGNSTILGLVGKPGNELLNKIMRIGTLVHEATDLGMSRMADNLAGDPEALLLFSYLKLLKTDFPDILAVSLREYNAKPKMLLDYIGSTHAGKIMAPELSYIRAMESTLRWHAKTTFKNNIKYNSNGYMVFVTDMFSKEEKLLHDTHNILRSFEIVADGTTRKNAPRELLSKYRQLDKTVQKFHRTRAEEHLLAFEKLEGAKMNLDNIKVILEQDFNLKNLDQAQLTDLKVFMTTYVKETALNSFRKGFDELVRGHDYGGIFNVYKRLETIKRFKMSTLNRAIKEFRYGLIKPILDNNQNPEAVMDYFVTAFKKQPFYSQMDEPMTRLQMRNAEIRRRVQRIMNYVEQSYDELEINHVAPIREAFSSLQPAGKAPIRKPSIFSRFVQENNRFFKRTPFDDLSGDGNFYTKVFRNGDGTEYTGEITIEPNGIYINGEIANGIVVDAETQGMRNTFDEFGERVQEAFQYSIKDTITGENKIYWIMIDGGHISPEVAKYTGITDEFYQELVKKGRVLPNKEALQMKIAEDFPNANLFIAHNAGFDVKYMSSMMRENLVVMDSLPLLRLIYGGKYSRFGLEDIVQGEFKGTNTLEELTARLKKEVASDLQIDAQLDNINFHNANFDTEVLHKLLFKRSQKDGLEPTLELYEIMKKYGITDLNDLNNSQRMLFTGEVEKALLKETYELETSLNDFAKIFDPQVTRKMVRPDLQKYYLTHRPDISQVMEKTGTTLNENINISESKLLRIAEDVYEEFSRINELMKDPTTDTNILIKRLIDLEERVNEGMWIVNKTNEPGIYATELDNLPVEVVDFVKTAESAVIRYRSVFEMAANRQAEILDKFYGNATGHLVRSKFYSHSLILSELSHNQPIRRMLNILKNLDGTVGSTVEVELRHKMAFLKARMLDESLLEENFVPPVGRDAEAVQKAFAEKFSDHPLYELESFLEEIDEYARVQDEVFEILAGDEKFRLVLPDDYHLAVHSMYDLMYQMDKAFYRLLEGGEVPSIEDLRLIYNQLSLQTGANKFVKNMSAKELEAYRIVDHDAIEHFWAYVVKRYDKITSGEASQTTRLLMNPDSDLTNKMYYRMKDFFGDVMHSIDSGAETTLIRDEFSGKVTDTIVTRKEGTLARQFDQFFEEILRDLRKPLKDIKLYNRANSMQPMHLGQLREAFYNTVYKNDNPYKYHEWAKADMVDETALSSLGAQNVFKLSRATSEVRRIKKGTYDWFEDLTAARKTMKDIGDQADEFGTGAWFKDLDFQETKLAKILDQFMKALDYEGTIYDLVKYAKSNQIKSHFRMIKVERLDNLIAISKQDANKTFGAIEEAWKLIEEWAGHPFTTYLKNDGINVDPMALQEFSYRFKATLYDFLTKTESTKWTLEMNKGYTAAEILEDGAKQARKMTVRDVMYSQTKILNDVRPHFEDSYSTYRSMFFDDTPEGIERFIKFANDNGLVLAYQVQGKNGIRLMKFNNLTPDVVKQFDDAFKSAHGKVIQGSPINHARWGIGELERPLTFGIVDSHQFMTVQKMLKDTFKFPEGSWQAILRKALLAPLKVTSLFSANFTLGNALDITLKNVKETEGGMFASYTMFYNTYRAMKMHTMYTRYYDEAIKVLDFGTYDNFSKEWVEAYARRMELDGKLTSKMRDELEAVALVNEFTKTEAAASEMNQMLMRMRQNVIGKGHQDSQYEAFINKVFFSKWGTDSSLNFNPFSANLQFNGWLETVGRLGMHLDNVSKGLSKNESLNRILTTHFNYSNKSQAEMYGEFIIPFISYPLRSFEYWSEALFSKGIETRTLFKGLEVAWGDALDDNSYAQYQMSRGNIPVGDHVLQTGFTFMDAWQMGNVSGEYGILPDQAMRKMNPLIKNLVQPGLTPEQRIGRMPGISHVQKFANIPSAMVSNDYDELFPSVMDPYYRGSWNKLRRNYSYRNPYLSRPTNSQTVSFRMFGKYKYSPMNRVNYSMVNTSRMYRL